METTANPCLLHAAVLAGRVKSVKVIIDHKKDWIKKPNKDGLGAIHMASEKGSAEIVKVLLEKDPSEQNQLRSTDGRRALHFAVLSESEDVLRELTRGIQPDQFVSNLTDENEPILHYALKKNRIQSFMHLLKLLKENINEGEIKSFLNVKDDDGHTVLHIATERRQIEVLKLLLPQNGSAGSINLYQVDMNASNKAGDTALDVFYKSQANVENINNKIVRMLQEAGPCRSQNTPQVASSQENLWNLVIQASSDQFVCKLWDSLVTQQIKASDASTKDALMVVAVLIATITYQAVLSPPGGFKQPQGPGNNIANQLVAQEDQQHFNGMAVIASDTIMFAFITIFGSIGFFSSMFIIIILTRGFPLRLPLWLAVGALCADFIASLLYIAPIGFNIVCGSAFILAAFLATQLFWILISVGYRLWNSPATNTRDTTMQPNGHARV